ncbi:MAG: molybdopterin-binding protein, partial [Proteobacteria bacterium]|nr:molybdopterin-binding protein [Pseudomonadota bacterium]
MISYDKALDIVRQRAKIKAHVRIEQAQLRPLLSSLGHVLSDAIHSPEAVPPFDNSAMDGFALRASDTQLANFENPVTFKVGACLAAGDPPQRFDHEAALEIMTGAAMPLGGFDAVLRVEDAVRIEQDASILVQKPVQTGDNVRRRGSDFQVKQKLAEAGEKVSSELIMACASLGVDVLPTHAPIRIALLITGRELSRYSDKALEPGMIRDASGPFLLSALQTADLEIVAHKMLPDDPELFQSEVLRILELQPDIILST